MKNFAFLFSVIFAFISCNCQKKAIDEATSSLENSMKQENLKLEYTATTRGFYQNISIENQMVTINNDRNSKEIVTNIKISNTDWKELLQEVKKINLDALETYKDPSQARFYDGAAIANLTINKSGKEYKTKDFDHGNPPVEIEKLVIKIVSLGNQK